MRPFFAVFNPVTALIGGLCAIWLGLDDPMFVAGAIFAVFALGLAYVIGRATP